MTILEYLISHLKLSSTTKARKLLKSGSVKVNGIVIVKADHEINSNDDIKIANRQERKQSRAPFVILYEDEFILIAVKPAGILSESFFKKVREWSRVFLTHRLDREVSGAMIFAKSIEIEHSLENNWHENDKIYWAICEGKPKEKSGRIETWLAENRDLKVFSTTENPDAKRAVTHYRVLESWDNRSLVEVRLETGRKHQIRVHLSGIGCPIIGDRKYGSQVEMKGRIALHALRFSVTHPVSKKRISVTAPLPREMEGLLRGR